MKRTWLIGVIMLIVLLLVGVIILLNAPKRNHPEPPDQTGQLYDGPVTELPAADRIGSVPLETTLEKRRSVRAYADAPLTLQEISQLLWAAQGITEPLHGLRTAPSAGALYPLEILLVAGVVNDLAAGVYRYVPRDHCLVLVMEGDLREALSAVALNQEAIREAPVSLVIAAVPARTTATYGSRGIQYVHMEVGHAGQNISLQAVALDLGTVVIGAFNDKGVRATIGLTQDEEPCYIMPVGRMD